MNVSNDRIAKFMQSQASPTGKLPPEALISYGRQAATTREKINQFFQHYFVNIFKYGFEKAKKKKEEFFIKKSIAIIQDINLKKLIAKIEGISPQEIVQYLGQIVKKNEVLTEESPHWTTITSLHQSYHFLAEARSNLEHHWLKDFAHSRDLGPHLEFIDPIERQEQVRNLLKLDTLQKETLIPHFNELLLSILGSGKLKEMTKEQLNEFELALDLYRHASSDLKKERVENTKRLLSMLQDIEKSKGLEARQTFQDFLKNHSAFQHLLLRLPLASVKTLLDIQSLCSRVSSLPIDLAFSQTTDEIVQKLNDELPENKDETLAKRLGPEFIKSYHSLTPEDQNSIDSGSSLTTLQKIEEDYRLNGRSQDFLFNMKKAMDKGFRTPKDLAQIVERLHSHQPLQLHLMTRLGDKIRQFLSLGISPQQVLEFQQQALQKGEAVTRQVSSKIMEGLIEGKGKSEVDEKIQAALIPFNQAQLEQAKQEWITYGQDFVDSFLLTLGSEVKKGLVHYKEKQTTSLEEVERVFVLFNAHQLKSQYGPALISHTMHYLLSPAGKELIKNDPNFVKQEWPVLLKNFQDIRQGFFEQGVTPLEFEEALNQFLTQSSAQILFLNDVSLEAFSTFLQNKLTEKQLNEMKQTHGEVFVRSLIDYLTANEPDVLKGTQSLKDSFFSQASSFSDQVNLLMPYLLTNFQPLGVLDKEMISSSLLTSPVTPQNLMIRSHNLNLLKEIGKGYPSPSRELSLTRELIRDLSAPYLIDFNLDRQTLQGTEREKDQKQQKIAKESIEKLVKFCLNEIDKFQVYSPHLLSQAMVELLKQKGHPQDSSLKQLSTVTEECDAFFNSGIKKDFQLICFQLYVKEAAKETCAAQSKMYSPKVAQCVEGLLARFSEQQAGLQFPQAAEYIKDLTQFTVKLSLTTEASNFDIFNALLSVSKPHILFHVEKINERAKDSKKPLVIPLDVKEQLIRQLKSTQPKTTQSNEMMTIIQNDPFAIVQALFPRFIENLMPAEDKKKVADIRKALIPLGPLFNQSLFVRKGVDTLSHLNVMLPDAANPDAAKKLIVEKFKGFNQLDIEELAKLGDRNKIRQALNSKELSLWMSVSTTIADKIFDAHANIQASSDVKKLAESDPFIDFMYNTLPKLAEDRKTIHNWIGRMTFFIPIIRTLGGGWIANKILQRYISSKLDKIESLDKPTKKLASASMESIIQTLLLATPALVKNHNIESYLNFFDRLNQIMKEDKEPNQEELLIEVMKMIQQLTKELETYGPLLEEAIKHAVDQTAS